MKAVWIGLFILTVTARCAEQYIITTIAGGAPPPAGVIGTPLGVAVDAVGSVYFSSTLNFVFKLDSSGALTQIAGNSRSGYLGDGGPASAARMHLDFNGDLPALGGGVAVDRAGNVFVADTGNHRIRRIAPNGIITTVAGGGNGGLGDGGPAVSARLNLPWGVTMDGSGNLYIADLGNSRVRKVPPSGIITTVAGDGSFGFSGDGGPATQAQLNQPRGVTLDGAGNLFIADVYNFRIRKVSPDGIITTVAGDGARGFFSPDGAAATSTSFDFATRVVADHAGNLFIADANRVRKVSPDGIITTVAGNGSFTGNMFSGSGEGGPATKAEMFAFDIAPDGAGNLFIADISKRILKVSADGILTTSVRSPSGPFPSGDGGPAAGARLSAGDVAVDHAGNLFISGGDDGVRKVSPDGIITTVVKIPSGALAVDSADNLFLASFDARVLKVSPDGSVTTVAGNGTRGFSGDGGPAANAQLGSIGGVAVDSAGNIFLSDINRVRKVSPDGIITTIAGDGNGGFSGDGGPAAAAQLNAPLGVAVDSAGNLFIADLNNRRVRKVSRDGIITTVAGDDICCYCGVAVDDSGNLLIAINGSYYNDYFTNLADYIRKVTPDGAVTTLAGTGIAGYSGDGGPAITAQLKYPARVTVDSAGNIYVADAGNLAVRVLRPVHSPVVIGEVVDAASQRPAPISPGKLVVIHGAGLGAGAEVFFNGIAADVRHTSATEVTAMVPYAIGGPTAQVTVSYQGQVSNAFSVPAALSAPSLFTLNHTGAGQAAATNGDGTVNTALNPVRAGDDLTLCANGLGDVNGMASAPQLPLSVTIGGIPATVLNAGRPDNQPEGVMQVTVKIPSGVQPGGYVPVVLMAGDASTTDGALWIAVSENSVISRSQVVALFFDELNQSHSNMNFGVQPPPMLISELKKGCSLAKMQLRFGITSGAYLEGL